MWVHELIPVHHCHWSLSDGLLHEMPDFYKRRGVDALLKAVRTGGKVVFVDYHKPHRAHPLKGLMSLIFNLLEPFAKSLWENDIESSPVPR